MMNTLGENLLQLILYLERPQYEYNDNLKDKDNVPYESHTRNTVKEYSYVIFSSGTVRLYFTQLKPPSGQC